MRSYFARASIVSLFFFMTACPSPQRTTVSPRPQDVRQLPVDWLDISPTDERMKYLEISSQNQIADTRRELSLYKNTQEFQRTGIIPEPLLLKMRNLNEQCNMEYINSPYVIAQQFSPEMYSTASTNPELYLKNNANEQQNLRGIVDDWNRIWLIDEPSPLSPYPIVSP